MFDDHFDGYEEFTKNRIQKIENVFGRNWFGGKTVLELGCGHGDIGKHLYSLGARVTFADARTEYLEKIRDENPNFVNAKYGIIDQDDEWMTDEFYDLIIHFGVLYHLQNWKQDLRCTLTHTDKLLLESIVCPTSEHIDNPVQEVDSGQNAFNGVGSWISEGAIEKELDINSTKFIRLDDSSLNTSWTWDYDYQVKHVYDWVEPFATLSYDDKKIFNRRMWLVLK